MQLDVMTPPFTLRRSSYSKLIDDHAPFSPTEEAELVARIGAHSEEVRMLLWKHNLRYAVFRARKAHERKANTIPLSLDDLTHVAVIALWKAAQNFKVAFGARFTSYASWEIKRAMQEAIRAATPGFTPPRYHVKRLLEARKQEETGEPSQLFSQNQLRLTVARHVEPVFLDADAEGYRQVSDTIPAREDVHAEAEQHDYRAVLERMFASLGETDPRGVQVLRLRYGLDGPRKKLREIAETLSVSKQRIEQIESRAMRRLRDIASRQQISSLELKS